MRRFLLFIFINALFSTLCLSQEKQIEFKHFSRQDGLTSTIIEKIAQDKDGFLWICQSTGISRFNGFEFENFNWIFGNNKNMIFEHITVLKNGDLLIGTKSSGLFRYNPHKNTIKQYSHSETNPNSINSNNVIFLFQDSNERIWVGTWFGISEMNETGDFKNYPFNTEGSQSIYNYNAIEDIIESKDGRLWIATWGGGLHEFNPVTKQFKHFEKQENKNKNLWIKKITQLKSGELLLATIDNGVLLFNPKTETFSSLDYDVPNTNPGFKRCLDVITLTENDIWIATEEGIIIYNRKTKATSFINDQGLPSTSLQNKEVEGFFQDNHNGLWVYGGGISYFNAKASKFQLYKADDSPNSLSDNEIQSFLEIDKKTIWVSTKKGINVWNREKDQFKLITPFPGTAHIIKKWRNTVFAALPRKGLFTYNLETKQLKDYTNQDRSIGLIDNHILSMDFDSDGNLWIGSLKGLSCLRNKDDKFIHFIENESYSRGLKSQTVSSLTVTDKNNLWILNHRAILKLKDINNSLLQINGQSGIISDTTLYSFKVFKEYPKVNVLESHNSHIYLSTLNEFTIFDLQENKQKAFRLSDGLSSDEINSVALDANEDLWLGTDNGLSYINLQTDEISNFYKEDGLQSNFFDRYSKLTLSSGEVLFGGNKGFNVINIDKIEFNPYVPKTVVTDIQVHNRSIPITTPNDSIEKLPNDLVKTNYSYLDELVLDHTQNSLTFRLSSLNFLLPEKNELAYYIDGVDKEWNYIKNRRYISYNNLPEGEWLTLKIKGSNNDGIWTTSPSELKIFITPPLYNTTWFKLLALLILICSIVVLYKLRIRNLKQQRNNLELEVINRTKQIKAQSEEIEHQNTSLKEQSKDLFLQNQNIALFSEIGQQITAAINISDIFNRTFEQISSIIKTDHIAIGRKTINESTMLYWEMGAEEINKQTIALNEIRRLSALSLKENRVIISNDIKTEIHELLENPDDDYLQNDFNSVVYIPLNSKTKGTIGIFVAKSKDKNAYNDKHINLLENICIYLTIAIENAWAYDQIKKQSEKLKELDRVKTRFYTNISHEFRTPLSLIIGPAEEIAKNPKISVKDKEYLEIISQNAKRMLRLVTQVLDLSKLEDGALRLSVVNGNITESIKNIIDSFKFIAERKNIKLSFITKEDTIFGYYDQDKIEKIIYNLLNNAFKYTELEGQITVRIFTYLDQNNLKYVTVAIEDTGIGIPSNDLKHVFKTYFRAENTYKNQQLGAGIGLSLVKKLAELHHGSIEVESIENKGSTFTLTIPLSEDCYSPKEKGNLANNTTASSLNLAEELIELEDRSDINIKKVGLKKLLIVEDNEDLLRFMVNSLEGKYDVDVVKDGIEALNAIEINTPDIIISDVMMPRMDGFQLTKNLKSNPKYGHIPIILLTAKNSFESQMEGLEFGADEYLVKPVNMELLDKRIANLLTTFSNVREKFESKLITNIDDLEVSSEHKQFLKKAVEVLEKNITNPNLNIDFFTEKLGMSRTLLYEKIKKATGDSMGVFIRKNRLNYSAKLLLENHYNTSELAYEVGYTDPKYFSKCFKKQFGKTPREYLLDRLNNSKTK